MAEMLRLNKALAAAGQCSRRGADALIAAGEVRVNGELVKDMGRKIDPQADTVTVRGRPIDLRPNNGEACSYLMLHKPVQVVSTVRDPEGRTTVLDLLPAGTASGRMYPVGRLDYFSEGLLLLTNDGELTHRLTHPRYHLPKEYEVLLRTPPDKAALAAMRAGMTLAEGDRLAPVRAGVSAHNPTLLLLTLHQGVNRQIRRMCRDLNLTILRLTRVRLGPLELGDLPAGASRPLSAREKTALFRAAGLERPESGNTRS